MSSLSSRLTISVLCRNNEALSLAHTSFNKALGLSTLTNPTLCSTNQSSSSSLLLGKNGLIELVSSPVFSNMKWIKGEQIRLLSVEVSNNLKRIHRQRALDHALSIITNERSGALTAASFLSSIGLASFSSVPHIGPFVLTPTNTDNELEEVNDIQKKEEDDDDDDEILSISEVVLGAHSSILFDTTCTALETVGAKQDPTSLSVFRLPNSTSAIRVIPGKHSALALSCENFLPRFRERVQDFISENNNTSFPELRNYGERHSETGSIRQIAIRGIPALQGLDIRLMEGVAPDNIRPFWVEGENCYDDDVDPALNPAGTHVSKQQSLSCASVVGMEVMSTIRTRLGMR